MMITVTEINGKPAKNGNTQAGVGDILKLDDGNLYKITGFHNTGSNIVYCDWEKLASNPVKTPKKKSRLSKKEYRKLKRNKG